jgi:hypothetical protein
MTKRAPTKTEEPAAPVLDVQSTPLPSAEVAQPVTLDDLQNGTPDAQPQPEAAPAEPMSEEQILGLVGFLTSMGLPPAVVGAYQADLANNMLLKMFLPMLDLPGVLAKYGIGSGAGGPMPEWLRGVLGAGLVGYVVFTTRSQYANNPQPKDVFSPSGSVDTDSVPSGFSQNIPADIGSF